MPPLLAQTISPAPAPRSPTPADQFRMLTGWAGITTAILIIVLICAIALISRSRLRLAASLRKRKPAPTNTNLDPWAESARRLAVPDADPPSGDKT